VWWIVRSKSEPRSNSPVIGNLPTSFWRACRVLSRILHKNASAKAANVNSNPSDLAVLLLSADSVEMPPSANFAPESSYFPAQNSMALA
jgi:hypothetical protein